MFLQCSILSLDRIVRYFGVDPSIYRRLPVCSFQLKKLWKLSVNGCSMKYTLNQLIFKEIFLQLSRVAWLAVRRAELAMWNLVMMAMLTCEKSGVGNVELGNSGNADSWKGFQGFPREKIQYEFSKHVMHAHVCYFLNGNEFWKQFIRFSCLIPKRELGPVLNKKLTFAIALL